MSSGPQSSGPVVVSSESWELQTRASPARCAGLGLGKAYGELFVLACFGKFDRVLGRQCCALDHMRI